MNGCSLDRAFSPGVGDRSKARLVECLMRGDMERAPLLEVRAQGAGAVHHGGKRFRGFLAGTT